MLVFVAIIIFLIGLLYFMPKQQTTGPGWTVYGSMGCGWTRKQLDHLKEKGIKHTFVSCDKKGACPSHVKGFPTSILPDGTTKVGFTKLG